MNFLASFFKFGFFFAAWGFIFTLIGAAAWIAGASNSIRGLFGIQTDTEVAAVRVAQGASQAVASSITGIVDQGLGF